MKEIKQAVNYSIMMDETSDISKTEQVSICIHITNDDLIVSGNFIGFFETPNTKSKTLFNIVIGFLKNEEMDIKKLRGQCYDGAKI